MDTVKPPLHLHLSSSRRITEQDASTTPLCSPCLCVSKRRRSANSLYRLLLAAAQAELQCRHSSRYVEPRYHASEDFHNRQIWVGKLMLAAY